jgi:twinkle protein
VHLVAHPRKADDERRAPGKQDVAGSGKITNMADNHFSVWAALKDEEAPPDDSIDAKLELNKQRNGDTQHRTLYLWFDKHSQQHTISSRRQPRRFGDWEARA